MTLRRIAALTLAAAAITTGGVADAAKLPCNMINDPSGDGYVTPVSATKSEALDIRSGDIATGKKTLVAVLRVGKTSVSGDPIAVNGMQWMVGFKIGPSKYKLYRNTASAVGNYAESYRFTVNDSTSAVLPKVTVTGTTITWTLPRSAFAELKKPRQFVTEVLATTEASTRAADTAVPPPVKYADRSKRCVNAA